jgi:hypothetical protein
MCYGCVQRLVDAARPANGLCPTCRVPVQAVGGTRILSDAEDPNDMPLFCNAEIQEHVRKRAFPIPSSDDESDDEFDESLYEVPWHTTPIGIRFLEGVTANNPEYTEFSMLSNDFQEYMFTTNCILRLGEALKNNTHVKVIRLEKNGCETNPDTEQALDAPENTSIWYIFFRALRENNSVDCLELQLCNIFQKDYVIETFIETMLKFNNRSMKHLSISFDRDSGLSSPSPECMSSLFKNIFKMTTLEELHIDCLLNMPPPVTTSLYSEMRNNFDKLDELKTFSIDFRGSTDVPCLDCFFNKVWSNMNLTTFKFHAPHIRTADIHSLTQFIEDGHFSLKTLEVSNVNMTDDEVAKLAKVISENKTNSFKKLFFWRDPEPFSRLQVIALTTAAQSVGCHLALYPVYLGNE